MKNIFKFSSAIKSLIFVLGLMILGSCSSVKNPQFLKSSIEKAEAMSYVQPGTDFFKEPDWKEHNLKGKVRTLTKSIQVLHKKTDRQTENAYAPYTDHQTLFDRLGNYIETFHLKENNKLTGRKTFNYKPKERIVEEASPEGGRGRSVSYYYYDSSKQKRQKDYNYLVDVFNFKTVYQYHYDEKNRLILLKGFQSEEPKYTHTYKYDDEKNTREEISWDLEGNQNSKRIYEYNDNGDIVREYYTSKNQNYDFTIDYEIFDDRGNWTQRRVLSNGNPVYLNNRTIEYYD